MAADLASLALKIDSTQVKQGVTELDKLTAAGGKAEASIGKMGAGAATAGAQVKSASATAAEYAANAQRSATAAMGLSSAHSATAAAGGLARVQMLELTHVVRGFTDSVIAGQNPLKALLLESGRIGQVAAGANGGLLGLGKTILEMARIIKTTGDADARANAASAAEAQRAIAAKAAQAQANIVAADTESALADAQMRVAATATEKAAAEARSVAATEAITAASTEAVIASEALAAANEQVAVTAAQAAAAETTALAPLGAVLIGIGVALGGAAIALKDFKSSIDSSGQVKAYADSLGLTNKEFKELESHLGVSAKDMRDLDERAKAFNVTWGDVWHGLVKTVADRTGQIGSVWNTMWGAIVKYTWDEVAKLAEAAAEIYGAFAGAADAIGIIWKNLGAIMGHAVVAGVNVAIGAIETLINTAIKGINALMTVANPVLAAAKMAGLNVGIPEVKFGRVADPDAEKATNAMSAAMGAFAKRTQEARTAIKGFGDDLRKNTIGAAEDRIKTQADSIIADRTAKKPPKPKKDTLGDEIRATEAYIVALGKLADAYLVSDAAAFKAEVTAKATEEAIKKHADVAMYVDLQLRKAVAEKTVDAAKAVNGLQAQTDAQAIYNNQVEQGLLTVSEANRLMKDEQALRPYLAALANAEGAAKTKLADIIARLRGEQKRSNDEAIRAKDIAGAQQQGVQTAITQRQIELTAELGAKQMAAIQGLRGEPLAEALAAINVERQKSEIRIKAESAASEAFKEGLYDTALAILKQADAESHLTDLKAHFDDAAGALTKLKEAADGLSFADAFGAGGAAIDGMLASLKQLSDQTALYNSIKNNGSTEEQEKNQAIYKNAQLNTTIGLLGATKKLFAEQSAGYKIIEAAEKSLAAIQLVRTVIHVAAGAAKIFASLGPFGFPVVAAMLGVMASLGFKGGGTTATAPLSAEQQQAAQGTGTVLGDPTAKSQSISDSLELMAANSNKQLEYSNAMVGSLRKIETGIGALASALARELNISGGAFDTGRLGLGSSGSAGFLGLFSSSTTRTLYDQGIQFASTTLADALAKGISGQTYNIVQQVHKSSGFLGIGGGTSTTYETTGAPLDSSITRQVQLILGDLRDTVAQSAKIFGFDIKNVLDKFQVDIGTISLDGLKGDEITKALEAVFSKVADQMAGFAVQGLDQFQKVGEGLFQTLNRLAKDYLTVDTSLKSIGLTFGAVGASSVAAREALVGLFSSLDDFTSQTDFYRQNFLTEAEQVAPVFSAVTAALSQLGLAGVQTIDQFKAVVNGLDLTTDAGRQTYAALMALAPAFSTVANYETKQAKIYTDQATSLRAYLKELTGSTAAGFAQIAATFRTTAAAAATGDVTALGNLKGASSDYLAAVKDRAGTLLEYQRARAQVLNSVTQGIAAADNQALIRRTTVAVETLTTQVAQLTSDTNTLQLQVVQNTAKTATLLNRMADSDTIRISNDVDTPVTVDLVA